jgi:hypothetical protein
MPAGRWGSSSTASRRASACGATVPSPPPPPAPTRPAVQAGPLAHGPLQCMSLTGPNSRFLRDSAVGSLPPPRPRSAPSSLHPPAAPSPWAPPEPCVRGPLQRQHCATWARSVCRVCRWDSSFTRSWAGPRCGRCPRRPGRCWVRAAPTCLVGMSVVLGPCGAPALGPWHAEGGTDTMGRTMVRRALGAATTTPRRRRGGSRSPGRSRRRPRRGRSGRRRRLSPWQQRPLPCFSPRRRLSCPRWWVGRWPRRAHRSRPL